MFKKTSLSILFISSAYHAHLLYPGLATSARLSTFPILELCKWQYNSTYLFHKLYSTLNPQVTPEWQTTPPKKLRRTRVCLRATLHMFHHHPQTLAPASAYTTHPSNMIASIIMLIMIIIIASTLTSLQDTPNPDPKPQSISPDYNIAVRPSTKK